MRNGPLSFLTLMKCQRKSLKLLKMLNVYGILTRDYLQDSVKCLLKWSLDFSDTEFEDVVKVTLPYLRFEI